jgi:hypothetical protein
VDTLDIALASAKLSQLASDRQSRDEDAHEDADDGHHDQEFH